MKSLNSKSDDSLAECGNRVNGGTLSLDVLVVYEDLETGLRAKQTLERTVQQLKASVDMQVDLWRFDLFNNPTFLRHATEKNPDIVFFSAHGEAQLPFTVDLWFREWLVRQADEPRALAVLLDDNVKDTPTSTEMVAGLNAAARSAGVEVFLSAAESATGWEPAIHNMHYRAKTRSLPLDEALHQLDRPPSRQWGINE